MKWIVADAPIEVNDDRPVGRLVALNQDLRRRTEFRSTPSVPARQEHKMNASVGLDFVELLSSVEAVVHGGKAVISADNSIVTAMMQEALKNGRSATFYVSPAQGDALMRWYWTPGRIKEIGMEPVSREEKAKIESELGFKGWGPMFSNRVECPCGGVYGMYEFIQQGIRQHEREWITAVMDLRHTAVIRINQAIDVFCPKCLTILRPGHWYEMKMPNGTLSYGCCSGPD